MYTIRCFSRSAVFLVALIAVIASSTRADQGGSSSDQEQRLLAILRSDSPGGEKAIACKQLAIHGSSEAVPELAKLLPNPQLSSWARIALEAIPGSQSDQALRRASESLQGRLLVGTINSIGVRRDAGAVDSLNARLRDSDTEVASAAAVALGHIGNAAATNSLHAALATAPAGVRSAVAEGYLLCAEQLQAAGKSDAAAAIYDEIRTADLPLQRVIEATRGAILARNQEGIPLLIETFQSPDEKLFQIALGTAREFPGGEVDKALATQLADATPERAALIIQAMADRPDTVVLAAVRAAAERGPDPVRLSAIEALRRVGDDTCLAALMTIATQDDADLAAAAKETLSEFPGQKVDQQIVTLLPDAEGKNYALLLELIGRRRIDAVSEVTKALDHADTAVRSAALIALGETVSLDQISTLIDQVVSATNAEDGKVALQALNAASIRMPDREACATKLAAAIERAPENTKSRLLEILSNVGGGTALRTLAEAATSGDPELLDTSSRLLGKWNSVDAAPVLLDLATGSAENKYKVRALRGYLGLARKFADGKQRAEMCHSAIDAAIRPDEQKLALQVLTLRPSAAGLQVAMQAQRLPNLTSDATKATLAIANELIGQGIEVKDLVTSAGFSQVNLEIIKAEYGSGSTQQDVTKELQKQAADIPLITLSSTSYNDSFGGDPTPGVPKQLRIQYRINGKPGEASFAENALILLPMPK